MKKNIHFIFGASGFIGKHLINKLLKTNNNIIFAFDKKLLNIKSKNIYFFKIDLSKAHAVNKILKKIFINYNIIKIDFFWQLAANSDIKLSAFNSKIDLYDTFFTTYNSLEIIKTSKIIVNKYIFSSTSAVYGENELTFSEKSPTNPISSYGAMKLASEACLSTFSKISKTKIYIIRFPNVIGTQMTHGLIYDLIKKIKKNKTKLYILGNGKQQKQYMTVNLLINTIFFIIKKSKEKYSLFNIASEDNGIRVSKIVSKFIKYNNLKNTKVIYEKKNYGWIGDVSRFKYNIKKLKNLGWATKENSRKAVEWTIKNNLIKN